MSGTEPKSLDRRAFRSSARSLSDIRGRPLQAIGRLALTAPRRIVAAALLTMVAAGVFGMPVADTLSNGGFRNPQAESSRASQLLVEKFKTGGMQLVVAVTSAAGAESPAARRAGNEIHRILADLPYVVGLHSAWTGPPQAASALISRDGKSGLIIAGITGDDSTAQRHAGEIQHLLPEFDDVTVKTGGEATSVVQIVEQSKKDLRIMETVALPVTFAVLVWVFGGVLAAAVPLAVGVFAIIGSMAVLRATALVTDVSIFALNLTLAMGLALAIDYTLLVISRFRDELSEGAGRDEALLRTMATAGRTVVFSAVTVALAMAAMAFFPIFFLKSFAYAGVAVVVLAASAALTVTPAALVLLGPRIDALDVRRLGRRILRRPEQQGCSPERGFWYRWTKGVMRHAVPIGLAVTALLLFLGAPFLGIKFGYPDDRLLPPSASARQVSDELRTQFAINSIDDVIVVLPDAAGLAPVQLDRYAARLSRIPNVTSVSSPGGAYTDGIRTGSPSAATGMADGSAFLTVNSTAPLYSQASKTQLDLLHTVTPPNGQAAEFTGWAQLDRDTATAVSSYLPLVLSVIAVVTYLLMFLFTGSIVVPLTTLLLNVLSLTAAFGALVWIFQDGHLGGFGTTATGTLTASVPMLLFCMAFGLATDYQMFVISRIREYWSVSGETRADNAESVALGLAHTGRVVTAAAILMALSFASMVTSQVSVMRIFGVGLPLAVLTDATLVRALLVPAFMGLLGRSNWWAPTPLVWLHRRIGISESTGAERLPRPIGKVLGNVAAETV
jgi:putative drug exporter of the RND superfamily